MDYNSYACVDCPWFVEFAVKPGLGRCFRHAPTVAIDANGNPKTYRPSVTAKDPACGESPYSDDVLAEFFEDE